MSPALLTRLRALAGGCLLLAACTDPVDPVDPPLALERNTPHRTWQYIVLDERDSPGFHVVADSQQTGGEVQDTHEFGSVVFAPDGDPKATGEVFSSPDGVTYWVKTEGGDPEGNLVQLAQLQSFKKNSDAARLDLHLTAIVLDAVMQGAEPCRGGPAPRFCLPVGRAAASLTVQAYDGTHEYANRNSRVVLDRVVGGWEMRVGHSGGVMFARTDLDSAFASERGTVRLARTVTVPVDISRVPVGSEFTLNILAEAGVDSWVRANGDGQGLYLSAYLRDPLGVGGSTLAFTGLTPTNRPLPRPPADGSLGRAPACAAPAAGAGTIQVAGPAFSQEETAFPGVEGVVVRRAGGASGPASVTLRTSDGTAVAGRDYQPLTVTVAFADGDTTPRTVRVPVLPNTRIDGDRTVNVTLSEPGGCATLGASPAVVTIVDDEVPPAPSFAVGGSVTGLTGSGLALRNGNTGETLGVGNGAFAFTQRVPDGFNYDVTVAAQPAGPSQVCTVTNGSGTVAGADATNVAVTCATPAPVGALDPAFGTGGKVTTPLNAGEARAVAVQPDGKIVVAGRSAVRLTPGGAAGADFTVLRYNPDGTPDAGFGTGGVATAGFPAGRTDEAFGVALQADGRIVVVGQTQVTTNTLDFALARFTADGRLDASFGTGGLVVTDFGPGSAAAQGVVVQADGRIVAAGHSTVGTGNDFAVARYNADGTPDATFGTGGRATTNVAGRTDLGMAVALAPGGKIVVAGRAEHSDGRGDDFAVVRYNADGTLDTGFGGGGIVTTDIAGGSQQANGVVVQADGRIVVAGYSGGSTGTFDFALARYNVDGTLDPGFGTAGTAVTDLSGQDDFGEGLALQADGRLVVVGRRTSATLFDLALVRYLGSGTPDAGFGTAGKVEVDFFGGSDQGQAVAVQSDGRIVGAGHARNGTSQHVVVVRVQP